MFHGEKVGGVNLNDNRCILTIRGFVWTKRYFWRAKAFMWPESRKKEGCLAVEMELAGVQAVCDFYGWDLYDFLATGDVLDQPVYDVSDLLNANHNIDKLNIAIEIAICLCFFCFFFISLFFIRFCIHVRSGEKNEY